MQVSSLRNVVSRSIDDYAVSDRSKWVQQWPGQVVLCTSQIFWTKLVAEALEKPNGLKDFLALSNKQIDGIVELVRGKLTKAIRTTLVCFGIW